MAMLSMKTPHDQTSIDLARSYLEILSATDLTEVASVVRTVF
jgi:hypothetical protein